MLSIIVYAFVGAFSFLIWFYHTTDVLVDKMCSRASGDVRPLDDTSVTLLSFGDEIIYVLKNIFLFPIALSFLKLLRKSMKHGELNQESLRHTARLTKKLATGLVVLGCVVGVWTAAKNAPRRAELNRLRAEREERQRAEDRERAALLDPANFFVSPLNDPDLSFRYERVQIGDVPFTLPVPEGYTLELLEDKGKIRRALYSLTAPNGDAALISLSRIHHPPSRWEKGNEVIGAYIRKNVNPDQVWEFVRWFGYTPEVPLYPKNEIGYFYAHTLGGMVEEMRLAQNTSSSIAVISPCEVELEDGEFLPLWLLRGLFTNSEANGIVRIGVDRSRSQVDERLFLTWLNELGSQKVFLK